MPQITSYTSESSKIQIKHTPCVQAYFPPSLMKQCKTFVVHWTSTNLRARTALLSSLWLHLMRIAACKNQSRRVSLCLLTVNGSAGAFGRWLRWVCDVRFLCSLRKYILFHIIQCAVMRLMWSRAFTLLYSCIQLTGMLKTRVMRISLCLFKLI